MLEGVLCFSCENSMKDCETSRFSLWIIRGKQLVCSQTFQQLCNGSLMADTCDYVACKLTMLECTDDKINEWIIFHNRLL